MSEACERAKRFLEEKKSVLEERQSIVDELLAARDALWAELADIERCLEDLGAKPKSTIRLRYNGDDGVWSVQDAVASAVEDVTAAAADEGEQPDDVADEEAEEPEARAPEKGSIRDRVLRAIEDEPGSTPKEIAEAAGLSSSQVSNALTGLKRSGLVEAKGERGAWSYFLAEDDEDDSPAPGSKRFLS